ncbi:MAG: DUF3168 domain-containing protein [Duncaniella sp.]|uniref:DUF3168 domain-containing protein n=1 Tax=Duncaniella sp. TaxID=2518496 RepID=UPI0023D13154|nr:DUF3168 domain-containing protein [Duncaniella sp.]MDE5989093.1 DUF3168 domain-containing protein [Duncaniella sp.]
MAVPKTSLSAGAIIRAVLLEDAEVSARTNKVFPVATDSAELPYILYRRASLTSNPQKGGQPGADEIQIEVICFTERYGEGVELAEAVRAALDHVTAEHDGMRLRSCYLIDSEEAYQDDAFVQQLVFSAKI